MKRLLVITLMVGFYGSVYGQVPQKMSYQAVIRNTGNDLIVNTNIGLQVSILQGSSTGTAVYTETHTTSTNENGLVTIEIGDGTPNSGTFSGIAWSTGTYFLKTEIDLAGGSSYTIEGTSQILSVPYALYSKSSGSGINISGNNTGDMLYWNGTGWINVPVGTTGQILTLNASNAPVWQNSSVILNSTAPNATASDATSILMNSSTLNGSVNANGFSTTVTFEYGTSTGYGSTTTATQSPVTGNSNTSVSKAVSSLLANTTYHFRIEASNAVEITNSNDMSFTTSGAAPTASTTASSGTTTTGTTLNGTVDANGFSTIVTFEYGLTTAYGSFASAAQSPVTGNANTNVSVSLSGLATGTTFHYRVVGTNSLGTTNGSDVTFTTLGAVPSATTNASTSILADGSTLNGSVNANYLSTTVSFEYGLTISYGSTVNATPYTVTGSTNTNVSASISGLAGGTTYHYRVKTTNSLGTTNGNDMTFTTIGALPTASTTAATNIAIDGSTLSGSVNANYLSTTVSFEYGLTISYGSTVNATPNTVTGSSNTNVSASITGLAGGTIYHYRLKATNSIGTSYGNDYIFTSYESDAITDIDNNYYNIVTIGTQVWLTENLKTTRYRNGDIIGTTSPITLNITGESTPKYQWASNGDENNVTTYGRVYTWYAAIDSRNVCPTGWHVPSDAEWTTLANYLIENGYGYGGSGNDIGKSMASTSGWNQHGIEGNVGNNQISNNSSGFTGRPSGTRAMAGHFSYFGTNTYWWSNTEYTIDRARHSSISWDLSILYQGDYYKSDGFAIRCLKN